MITKSNFIDIIQYWHNLGWKLCIPYSSKTNEVEVMDMNYNDVFVVGGKQLRWFNSITNFKPTARGMGKALRIK